MRDWRARLRGDAMNAKALDAVTPLFIVAALVVTACGILASPSNANPRPLLPSQPAAKASPPVIASAYHECFPVVSPDELHRLYDICESLNFRVSLLPDGVECMANNWNETTVWTRYAKDYPQSAWGGKFLAQ